MLQHHHGEDDERDPIPDVAARVLERVRSVADPRAAVEAFGSSIYAPVHADDVDVLVSGDDPAHQGLGQRVPMPPATAPDPTKPIVVTSVLGGLHADYRRAA